MSALDFWRKTYPLNKAPNVRDCKMPQGQAITAEEEVWSFVPPIITAELLRPENGVLHILAQNTRDRRETNTHRCHLWQGDFPVGSFYQLSNEAYVASPPFVFLQMAQQLTLTQLIALGDELCGFYSFDESARFGIRQREVPLVTIEDLEEFIAQARAATSKQSRGTYGICKAERALEYIVERSASPRETALALFLALPYRLGGYGFPKPEMNVEIPLTPEATAIAGRGCKTLRADLLMRAHFILEYNGNKPHSGEAAGLSDRARINALELMGYEVMELTHEQLDKQGSFEIIVKHLAKKLGKRLDPHKLGPLPKRMNLRNEVFSWNSASGRVR